MSVGGANYFPKAERPKTPVHRLRHNAAPSSNPDTMSQLRGPDKAHNLEGDIDSVPSMDDNFDSRISGAAHK